MRPSSTSHHDPESYEEVLKKQRNGWKKELLELTAKIRGSSFKFADKQDCLLELPKFVFDELTTLIKEENIKSK